MSDIDREQYVVREEPYYRAVGDEVEMYEAAYSARMPVMLKGPTGCGKSRFVEHMAARLGRPLFTVACHDDLSAADLVGRHLIGEGGTFWSDGPLTRSVREGAICYLDEVVEARKDTTVVLHPLTDDRRILPLERTGETLKAGSEAFMVLFDDPRRKLITGRDALPQASTPNQEQADD